MYVMLWFCLQTSSEGAVVEGDIDPPSLPVADHEQDGYVMVDLTDIVSRCHVICIFLYYTYVLGSDAFLYVWFGPFPQ